MNHYPRHVGDWMTATAHLTEVEECIYSRMIDQYYAREQPLPTDEAAVARLVRAGSAAARKAVAVILREFFALEADGWHQKRCDDELSRYHERSESARRSINTRWEKRNKERNTDVLRTNAERNTNQNQNQNQNQNHKTHSGGGSELPTSAAPPLPGTLSPPTWTAWRAHLANLGKPLTPQAERLQLARLAGHADPDAIVRKAIESGHRNLEPVGGYPDAKRNPTVHAKRAATAAAIYGTPPEPPNVEPTDITGEASRIA